jgi:hypothetical protein
MIVVADPRYKREIYHDHVNGPDTKIKLGFGAEVVERFGAGIAEKGRQTDIAGGAVAGADGGW